LIDPEKIEFFKSLYWDYQISDEEIITIIETGECKGFTRKNLLGRALKSCRWYEIKEVLPHRVIKRSIV